MKNQSVDLYAQSGNLKAKSSSSLYTMALVVFSLAFGIGATTIPASAGTLMNSNPTQLTLPTPCNPGSACGPPNQGIFPTVVFPAPLSFKGPGVRRLHLAGSGILQEPDTTRTDTIQPASALGNSQVSDLATYLQAPLSISETWMAGQETKPFH
jgi:hypothetical protein